MKAKDADEIVPYIDIKIKETAIYKQRLLMLDIVANNDWKRPIYFTGGAFGSDDYIWMEDYLQLDGMVYKLVPIATPVDRANPFDMGRVDSELMYNKVKNWDWGNSGSDDIYHDPETRRNSITYRGNLARLIEQLIKEEQLDKAEEIADIAMTNMPVDKFGYYTLLEPYIGAYYETNAKEKARKLFKDVSVKYQENLKYYSELSFENQINNRMEIYTDLERYRALIIVLAEYDEDFGEKEFLIFRNYEQLFNDIFPQEQKDEIPLELRRSAFLETRTYKLKNKIYTLNFFPTKIPKIIKRIFPNYVWDFSSKDKTLYLTFDDGPTPKITEWTLKTLKAHNAKATFFCIGNNVENHPSIFESILKEGHAIGNHTHNHLKGWKTHTETYLHMWIEAQRIIDLSLSEFKRKNNETHNCHKDEKIFRPAFWKD